MSGEIVRAESMPVVPAMDGRAISDRIKAIQEIMAKAMKKGVDYGTIPGCGDKPALLQPGTEKICAAFQLSPKFVVETQEEPTGDTRFVVTCSLYSGENRIADGMGAGSTAEDKYKWRKAVCQQEYDAAPETKRRIKWKNAYGKTEQILQVTTNTQDFYNTVLKMTCKRAMVAAVRNATGCSDVFSSADEIPDEMRSEDYVLPTREHHEDKPAPAPVAKPAPKATTKPATAPKAAAKAKDGVPILRGYLDLDVHTKPTSKGGTRYGIKVGGEWYNTFSDEIGKSAADAFNAGLPVELQYKANPPYGNEITYFRVGAPVVSPEPDSTPSLSPETNDADEHGDMPF